MTSERQSLILQQRVVKHANANLHCREVSLRLSSDQREMILTRYIEHYSPDGLQWVERSHRVPVTDLLRWVIEQGEAQTLVQGGDALEVLPIDRSHVERENDQDSILNAH
ncbi:hypothetical protein BLL42_18785 [Pseudomonas frederiksbergensis]|uniref:Uncharacterized protein n=1 Tax=Pseudomonas frederiksbergensis TaxID=104087 RepID=A0A1J0EPC7_9PSED|nr:hypothetical protein [Pseudomonas frederiksbergensis]APC17676.1 hypothetical protein BLL42_18785 [Pseudomonas frederiksbergensis]